MQNSKLDKEIKDLKDLKEINEADLKNLKLFNILKIFNFLIPPNLPQRKRGRDASQPLILNFEFYILNFHWIVMGIYLFLGYLILRGFSDWELYCYCPTCRKFYTLHPSMARPYRGFLSRIVAFLGRKTT